LPNVDERTTQGRNGLGAIGNKCFAMSVYKDDLLRYCWTAVSGSAILARSTNSVTNSESNRLLPNRIGSDQVEWRSKRLIRYNSIPLCKDGVSTVTTLRST